MAARAEYYHHPYGVIAPAMNAVPFQLQGFSRNVDRQVTGNVRWRLEGRWLKSQGRYFEKQGQ